MANVGDYVRFLNQVGGGRITRINGQTAYVTDEDGFETPALLRECVVVPADNPPKESNAPQTKAEQPRIIETPAPAPTAETETGDRLTAVIMFEPHDIKRLSTTAFDMVLVNDSNYYMLYAVATRERSDSLWTLYASGTVEPNTQILLGELEPEDLPGIDRLNVQLVAYKSSKPYEAKAPVSIDTRLDVTKLARLHCFSRSPYSTVPVLTVPLVKDDEPHRQPSLQQLVANDIRPKASDRAPANKPAPRKAQEAGGPQVVDLHIHELVDTTAGMDNAAILSRQVEEFHRRMKAIKSHPGESIIFIHGKGEGVLRHTILDQLRRYYPKCTAQDASFREYGFGATQITVH